MDLYIDKQVVTSHFCYGIHQNGRWSCIGEESVVTPGCLLTDMEPDSHVSSQTLTGMLA